MNLFALLSAAANAGGFGDGIENATMGEKVVFSLQVVLIGMGVVFGVLVLLIGILQLFKLFSGEKQPKAVKPAVKTEAPAPVAATNAPSNASEEEKIVAIATAAIAAARGKSEINFNVISIAPIGGAAFKGESKPVAEPAPAAATEKVAEPVKESAPAPVASGDGEKVNAPLPGNILDVKVSNGATVKKGDILCILEAMKMENEIVAPVDGTVLNTVATKGSSVNTGDLLFVIG